MAVFFRSRIGVRLFCQHPFFLVPLETCRNGSPWSATDPSINSGQVAGSGVKHYDVLYRVDDSEWVLWLNDTTGTTETYNANPGHTYAFRVCAVDHVGNEACQKAAAKTVIVKKYYSVAGQRVAMRSNGVLYYLHSDHLGSTSLTTNETGAVVAAQRYLPYGEVRWINSSPELSGTLPTDLTYTGQRSENGPGLMDYRARFYSSRLGRFVSADTLVPNPAVPQLFNRYSYAGNNPVLYNDPDGHCGPLCWAGIVFALGVTAVALARDTLLPEATLPHLYASAASSYGVPVQIVAGVLESEQALDTDFLDQVETAVYSSAPLAVVEQIVARKFSDPGPGIGNIHVSTAQNVSAYFAKYYPDCEEMQLNIHNSSTAEVTKMLTDDSFNIKVAAAVIRQLADYRFGTSGLPRLTGHENLSEWTTEDAVAIWHGYRYGVDGVSPVGYGLGFTLDNFQNRKYSLDEMIARATGIGAEDSMRRSLDHFKQYLGVTQLTADCKAVEPDKNGWPLG